MERNTQRRVYAAVMSGQDTVKRIMYAAHLSNATVWRHLQRLQALGLVKCVRSGGRSPDRYAIDPKKSVARQLAIEAMIAAKRKLALQTKQSLLRSIKRRAPVTASELQESSGLCKSQVNNLLKTLQAEGKVRAVPGVTRRMEGRGKSAALYELGDGRQEQAPVPEPPRPEVNAVFRHPMDVALFGESRRAA